MARQLMLAASLYRTNLPKKTRRHMYHGYKVYPLRQHIRQRFGAQLCRRHLYSAQKMQPLRHYQRQRPRAQLGDVRREQTLFPVPFDDVHYAR